MCIDLERSRARDALISLAESAKVGRLEMIRLSDIGDAFSPPADYPGDAVDWFISKVPNGIYEYNWWLDPSKTFLLFQRKVNDGTVGWVDPLAVSNPGPSETVTLDNEENIPERVACLREAERLTLGQRDQDYGDPVVSMQHIADIFNAWTGHNLTAREIAQVQIATKLARSQKSPLHRDSYIDSQGYRGIELECALSAAEKEKVDGQA